MPDAFDPFEGIDVAPPPGARAPSRRRRGWRRGLLGVAALALVGGAGAGAVAWSAYDSACALTPCVDLTALRQFAPNEGSVVYDRGGREIGRFSVENRHVSTLTEMSAYLPRAVVAIEDKRFYRHRGVDVTRVFGALAQNVLRRRTAQGFSTLTMQLARNTYPEFLPYREKSLARKLREVRVAREIEAAFTKDEILYRYLNQIYLGEGAYGVDAAAWVYFGKPVGQLTLAEAALLAALPKAPSTVNPFRRPAAAVARRNLVLRAMREQAMITAAQEQAARAEPLRLARGARAGEGQSTARVAPYFVEAVRKELAPIFGDRLYRAGLRIYTTLDPALQRVADSAVVAQIAAVEAGRFGLRPAEADSVPLQGAAVVLDAADGGVRALVGGRDFALSKYDRATQARRQPGSAFKPFVYAAAVEAGWVADDEISDDPLTITLATGEVWSPDNFDEEEAGGSVTLARALAQSRNRAAVRLSQEVGLDSVIAVARRMGLDAPLAAVPSLALGAFEVRLLDLTAAYTPVARTDGQRVRARLIDRVTDRAGRPLLERTPDVAPALDPGVAADLRDLLRGVVDHGTGGPVRQAGYAGPAAGKTGTSNGGTDLWFVGVTPSYAAGVWFGYDTPRTVLRGVQGTGGRLAAPAWGAIMRDAMNQAPVARWVVPESLQTAVAPPPAAPPAAEDDTTQLCVRAATPDQDASLVPCRSLRELRELRGRPPARPSPRPASAPDSTAPPDGAARGDGLLAPPRPR